MTHFAKCGDFGTFFHKFYIESPGTGSFFFPVEHRPGWHSCSFVFLLALNRMQGNQKSISWSKYCIFWEGALSPPPGNSAFLQNATILFSHPNFSKDLRFLNHSALLICSFVENVNEDPIVIVNGLTKCWRLPGWRICWVCHSSSSLAAANHKIFKSQTCLCKCG